ncbi:MAG: diacylglyceryl transferase [Chloroflexi bacterium]|nr:diacylglyceryl transferase [Chloroflexota bacterium]
MAFPLYPWIGPIPIHPHLLFELLTYGAGFVIYRVLRARWGDPLPAEQRWTVIAAAAFGAAIGGKLLYWGSDPGDFALRWQDAFYIMGGKSVLGAIAGGLVAVELVKRRSGITVPTGDLLAVPLALGIGIGRIGCFLTGLGDHTYGLATSLPWAVDFGDGIARHPTQLCEVLFVWALGGILLWAAGRGLRMGALFRLFIVGYAAFRIGVEFIKPGAPLLGLNALQWVALAMLIWAGRELLSQRRKEVARA